jgi:succinate-semialdehyde dehydrogenase / glutarate-semialdehyde dehydrogenase
MQDQQSEPISLSVNPATGEVLSAWPLLDERDAEAAIDAASNATRSWRRTPATERAQLLRAVGAELRGQKDRLARLVSLEMGKPLAEALAEIEKSAWNCELVAEQGPAWLQDEPVATSARDSRVVMEPLGVVLSVLPWNFPVWQAFRCVSSALMAGNTCLIKHAPNVQGCATLIAEIARNAGLPRGVLQNLHLPVERVAATIADRRVAAVTLTGGPVAGAQVAALAGAACKKSVLELGGSDAFIVLEDADLDAAIRAAVRARFTNCGQVCLAAKRFIVQRDVAPAFAAGLASAARSLRRGDPLLPDTELGPLARADLRTNIDQQVRRSVQAGATLLTGGATPAGAGWFYEPTVLSDVAPGMPVFAEETFGPVAAIVTVPDASAAVALANDSPFGLSTMLWTADVQRALSLSRDLEVGSVFINAVTASDPRLPVGGVKLSGYGRELGRAGLLELCNLKTVWVG